MDRADCPCYRPSRKDMSRSMEKFIESIEAESGPYGICKITPPSGWTPCAQGYQGQDSDTSIGRIDQEFTRETMVSGFYSGTMTPLRKQTVREFKQEAERSVLKRRRTSAQIDLAEIEKAYWKGIAGHTTYGADNEGSLFDQNIKVKNLSVCLLIVAFATRPLQAVHSLLFHTTHLFYRDGILPAWTPASPEVLPPILLVTS